MDEVHGRFPDIDLALLPHHVDGLGHLGVGVNPSDVAMGEPRRRCRSLLKSDPSLRPRHARASTWVEGAKTLGVQAVAVVGESCFTSPCSPRFLRSLRCYSWTVSSAGEAALRARSAPRAWPPGPTLPLATRAPEQHLDVIGRRTFDDSRRIQGRTRDDRRWCRDHERSAESVLHHADVTLPVPDAACGGRRRISDRGCRRGPGVARTAPRRRSCWPEPR